MVHCTVPTVVILPLPIPWTIELVEVFFTKSLRLFVKCDVAQLSIAIWNESVSKGMLFRVDSVGLSGCVDVQAVIQLIFRIGRLFAIFDSACLLQCHLHAGM